MSSTYSTCCNLGNSRLLLNDSIVIADRIRELLIAKPNQDIEATNNEAIIATFSRNNGDFGIKLIRLGYLWLLGGASLQGFFDCNVSCILTGKIWSSISVGTLLPEFLGLKPEHYQPNQLLMSLNRHN